MLSNSDSVKKYCFLFLGSFTCCFSLKKAVNIPCSVCPCCPSQWNFYLAFTLKRKKKKEKDQYYDLAEVYAKIVKIQKQASLNFMWPHLK